MSHSSRGCSGRFYLARTGLFRIWSFQGFQSILIPLLWFYMGSLRSPASLSLGCPGSQPRLPLPTLLQREGSRNIHHPQQDVVAINKGIITGRTPMKAPDAAKYFCDRSSQREVQLVAAGGLWAGPPSSQDWDQQHPNQRFLPLERCPLWQHEMGTWGLPGKCELQINGKQSFHVSMFHITVVREAAHTYTKKLFLVYLNSTLNWSSYFYWLVCLLLLDLVTPRYTVLGSASPDHDI